MTTADNSDSVAQSWTVHDDRRPRSLNAERAMHHMAHRRLTNEDRERWGWLWHKAGVHNLQLPAVAVEAYPSYRSRPQDAGNCLPSVKAAIDALVDVGAIPDDAPEFVRAITMHAPDPAMKADGLTLVVRQAPVVRLDLAEVADVLAALINPPVGSYEDWRQGGAPAAAATMDQWEQTRERARVALASVEFARC